MKKIIGLMMLLFSFNLFAAGEVNLKNIKFKDLEQNTVTLEQYQGKKLYVKMWASWCPICLAGLAEINELSGEPNNDAAIITIVSPEHKGEKSTADFIQWYKGLDYKNIIVLLDEEGEVIKKAKVRGYPTNLILDASLNVTKTIPGHLSAEQIKRYLSE
ncbi:redoxin family protein [Necropsobacter massiliensis]|uniref:redoxin family protein n=1 Tax=Necropsobacter massiliensis TaxID=1400001 RepID=UPI0005961633|nr:redoxin family protein [Necropsobacter massiliensis]